MKRNQDEIKIVPVNHRLLIKRIKEKDGEVVDKKEDKIVTPENNKRYADSAVVYKTSFDVDTTICKVGDIVYFPHFTADDIDEDYALLSIDHILAIKMVDAA